MAVNGTNLYWAMPGRKRSAIGTIPLADFPEIRGPCSGIPTCDNEFVKPTGTSDGLAADATHLYWSINGETPTNPGNDLYRYEPGADKLDDLTPPTRPTKTAPKCRECSVPQKTAPTSTSPPTACSMMPKRRRRATATPRAATGRC